MEKDRVRIKLWIPHLTLNSNYAMEGRILMMPIGGKGRCRGNYSKLFVARFSAMRNFARTQIFARAFQFEDTNSLNVQYLFFISVEFY